MKSIIQYDIALFSKINGQWHNSFFDWLLPFLRNQYTWAPLYLFAAVFMALNFKWKGLRWMIMFLVTFAITDMVSSALIKPWVARLRPCADPLLADSIRSLVSCGGQYGFPSSHASNHFGLAMFAFQTLVFIPASWRWLLFFWAFAVSYAQIYVGVHFPIDTICGALFGCLVGKATSWLFNKKDGFASLA